MIEILGLAANVNHPVDRTGAAEHLAARPEHAPIGGAGVGLGLVAPIDRRVGEGLAETQRDVDPAIGVVPAGFEQQYPRARVFGQPRGDRAPGRAGADDDEIDLDRVLPRCHIPLARRFSGGMMAARRRGAQTRARHKRRLLSTLSGNSTMQC
jgi:hypothetical protein